jgi:hypothetical protein
VSEGSENKKPDNIVWDEEKMKYNASLLPYGTNLSAPNITTTDTVVFLKSQSIKFNHYIDQKYQELREELEKLVDLYQLNELVYNSRISFEPVMGDTYHLYENRIGERFLSLIAPSEWNMPYICSVRLNTDGQWVLQKGS